MWSAFVAVIAVTDYDSAIDMIQTRFEDQDRKYQKQEHVSVLIFPLPVIERMIKTVLQCNMCITQTVTALNNSADIVAESLSKFLRRASYEGLEPIK